jgi:hypothetical protein
MGCKVHGVVRSLDYWLFGVVFASSRNCSMLSVDVSKTNALVGTVGEKPTNYTPLAVNANLLRSLSHDFWQLSYWKMHRIIDYKLQLLPASPHGQQPAKSEFSRS